MPEQEYVQGGADFPVNGGKKTKSALKRLIKEDPSKVYLFDTTSPSIRPPKFRDTADKLPVGMTFNVVGPDPYTDRSWYASVYRGRSGDVLVK